MTSCNTEVWRSVPGYADCYQVSNLGRFRNSRGIRQPLTNWDGYLRVTLKRETGERAQVALHRLVAKAFIPNPENKPQVNHKNGDRGDCRAENLEWVTNSENQKHRRARGSAGAGPKKAVVCTSSGQVYESLSEAARQTNTRIASIQECCKGLRKTAHGMTWAYKE